MTTETLATDHDITLNGLRFHYREYGPAGAPPLVLLHGFTGHARSWDTTAAALADRYHIFALDQRGHGDTEWADDYHPDRRVEDLEAFVADLGLGTFSLLGLSMGGICAYSYAARHPETPTKLVIVDIAPELEAAGIKRIGDGVAVNDIFESQEEAIAAAARANPNADEYESRHRVLHNLMQTPDGKWTYRYDTALRGPNRQQIPRPDPAPVWESLKNISCPTLLIRGALSDLLGRATAERFSATVPNCQLVEVANAGHSVPLENPGGFVEAVQAFL